MLTNKIAETTNQVIARVKSKYMESLMKTSIISWQKLAL
jgi:hypothetical protein